MTNDEKISQFLALPRELRDNIYLFLINERRPAPEDPSNAGVRDVHSTKIFFEQCSPKPALLQLKLCSKQTYAETTKILDKYKYDWQYPACLDIMVKGLAIFPTWTSLPVTETLHSQVDISLRLFESWEGGFNTSVYRSLWTYFNHLVFNGPCSRLGGRNRSLPTPLNFTKLRFVIRLCFPTSVDDWYGTYRDVFDRLERLAMDNVGLGHVQTVECCFGAEVRTWRLKQLPTGLTFASRV